MPPLQDATKLTFPAAVVVSIALSAFYLRGGIADEAQTMQSAHTQLAHAVELMRLELTRDLRELAARVHLGVSAEQLESLLTLFRARLRGATVRLPDGTVLPIGQAMAEAVPDLPTRR